MRRFTAVFFLMAAMAGLASAADAGGITGHRYVLTRVNGKALAGEREVFVEIGDNFALTGRFCNTFRGPATHQNGILKAENLASTRMICPDGDLSKLENELFQALRGGVCLIPTGDGMQWRRDASTWEFAQADAQDTSSEEAESSSPESGDIEARQLTGRKFVLRQVDGEDFAVDMDRRPFIEFSTPEDGLRVNGSACNSFTGMAELSGDTLTMANAAATMMMCVDPKLSTFERDFHQLLRDGVTVELEDGTLTLRGGRRVLTYQEE